MEQIKTALQGMKLLKTYRMGTRLYTAVTGCNPQPGVPTAVQVWYDPPATLAAGRLVTNDSDKEPWVASSRVQNQHHVEHMFCEQIQHVLGVKVA
jgi:hypothetical protein